MHRSGIILTATIAACMLVLAVAAIPAWSSDLTGPPPVTTVKVSPTVSKTASGHSPSPGAAKAGSTDGAADEAEAPLKPSAENRSW